MTSIVRDGMAIPHPLAGTSLVDDVAQLLRNHAARRDRRRLLRGLSRIAPRQLVDMGLDLAEVRDAVEGSWDEWHPDRLLRRAPWN